MAQTPAGTFEADLEAARMKLAPDRRTAVFDVAARAEGRQLLLKGEIHSQAMKTALVQLLSSRGWSVTAESLQALPHASLEGKTYGVVSVSVLNMRKRPAQAAELGTQAVLGAPLRLLKRERGWYLVQTADNYLGWTDGKFVQLEGAAFDQWRALPKVIITSTYATCTARDGEAVVGDLVAGSLLALEGSDESGYRVQYPDGRTGRVRKEDARPYAQWLSETVDSQERIVQTAHRFMGIPYMWGGTSTKAMDCSGFTKTVYFLNGVLLPRDASQQALVGDTADGGDSLDGFQPGDLLFFGHRDSASGEARVTHVGISLGRGRFIHESDDVHLQSFTPSEAEFGARYREIFLWARRVIGAGPEQGIVRLKETPYYAPYAH